MSSLSEELRRKIEANRLKAKAVRDQKQKHAQNSSASNSVVNKPARVLPASIFAGKSASLTSIKNRSPQKSTGFGAGTQLVKAKCVLITRDRFEIQASYCPPLVDLCRTTESAVYYVPTKRWNFDLKWYNSFIKKVREQLKDKVNLECLPVAVAKAFSSAISTGQHRNQDIPSYDLRNVDKTLLNSLFPFQLDAVNFVISKGGRSLIADDMGLGKTLEALGVASYYRDEWPLLIISPASVRHVWVETIKKYYSTQTVHPDDVFSPDGKKHSTYPSSKKYIAVVSYDVMKSQIDILCQKLFRIVIVDESHYIKDITSARCKLALKLLKNAKRVVLLSGTPALSRPIELFPQLKAISPSHFSDYHEFAFRYCDAKKRPQQFGGGLDTSGSSNLEELEILLKETVMIRRLKDEVMSQLQPKLRKVFILDKSLIQLENEALNHWKSVFFNENLKQVEKRGALLLFYNETAKAKLRAVVSHILTLLKEGRKIVVFAHHQIMMDELHSAICTEGFSMIKIDGSTRSVDRQKLCEKFQTDDDVKVALLSITAANTGLTLTSANLVVFAELFWNPGILVQAEDRVHRVGQEMDVEIQYLVAKGTADDEIWNLVKRKLAVLGKGGLSKDNFDNVSTTLVPSNTKNSQTTLDDFWENLDQETLEVKIENKADDFWESFNKDDGDDVPVDLDDSFEIEEPKTKRTKSKAD